jgi:hypothetical protein
LSQSDIFHTPLEKRGSLSSHRDCSRSLARRWRADRLLGYMKLIQAKDLKNVG